jgi:hypothetical protein
MALQDVRDPPRPWLKITRGNIGGFSLLSLESFSKRGLFVRVVELLLEEEEGEEEFPPPVADAGR